MITQYPDGQLDISLTNEELDMHGIVHSIRSYNDLFELASIVDVLKHNNRGPIPLYCPYLFGQRSDRRFDKKASFGFKLIADFINKLGFSSIELFDPHSSTIPSLLNRCNVNESMWEETVMQAVEMTKTANGTDELYVVSPDAGAYKKLFMLCNKFNMPLVAANKFRDLKGNIDLNFSVPKADIKDKHFIIIDDICEYGGTFKRLANELIGSMGAKSVSLYVSHFSGGGNVSYSDEEKLSFVIDGILEIVTRIYTTNSISQNMSKLNRNVFNVIDLPMWSIN